MGHGPVWNEEKQELARLIVNHGLSLHAAHGQAGPVGLTRLLADDGAFYPRL